MFYGRRAQLYTRLSTLADAGISIGNAFDRMAETSSGKTKTALEIVSQSITKGCSLREALTNSDYFQLFELEIIASGEQSARLPESFRALAEIFEKKKQGLIAYFFSLAYPVFLIHAAILLPNLAIIFSKGLGAYLMTAGSMLLAIYVAVAIPTGLYFILRSNPATGAKIDRILLGIPIIGTLINKTETARCITVLAYLYESGTPILKAMEQTPKITNNYALKALWVRVSQRMNKGETLTTAVASEKLLPSMVNDFIATGERTGQLDELLHRAASSLEEEAKNSRRILLALLTSGAFAVAALMVGYTVISFYATLYSGLR
jgi:type II secretory pathway component PulF